jgi:regulatory protein
MLIRRELGHKGLDDSLVGEAIGAVDATDELRSAVELAARLLRRHGAEPEPKKRQRILAALARRGFPGHVGREALSRAGAQEGLSS